MNTSWARFHSRRALPTRPKRSRPLVWLLGAGVYGTAVYAGILGASVYKDVKTFEATKEKETCPPVNQVAIYNKIATEYDQRIEWDECIMGLSFLRRSLAKQARGDLLESGVGSGRNMAYLPLSHLTSIAFIDPSNAMLRQAWKKWHALYPERPTVSPQDLRARQGQGVDEGELLVTFEAVPAEAIPEEERQYDTILQTFALCSTDRPVEVLESLKTRMKPGGRLLLLEHGQSRFRWLNRVLDTYAGKHKATWGCQWNKDIGGLVEQAGLHVESMKRYHLGTTWCIIASAKKNVT